MEVQIEPKFFIFGINILSNSGLLVSAYCLETELRN